MASLERYNKKVDEYEHPVIKHGKRGIDAINRKVGFKKSSR